MRAVHQRLRSRESDTTAAAMPVTRVRGRVDHVLTADCIIGACGICARKAAADAVVVIEIQHA